MRAFPTIQFPQERSMERYKRMLRLMDVSQRMTDFGVRVDVARAKWHMVQAQKREAEFRRMFLELTGLDEEALGESGGGHTKAVKEWFWVTAKAPQVVFHKKTKKPQFNTACLVIYASDYTAEPFSKAAAALFGLRAAVTAQRFAGAYVRVAEKYDGRIHFRMNPMGTKGERWSSSTKFEWWEDGRLVKVSLNAQNVPSKEPMFDFKDGRGKIKLALSLRDCFIPDPGCVWFKADYEALEGRLIAYISGGKLLIDWLETEGVDLHMENARRLFKEMKIQPHEKKVKKPKNQREQDLNDAREGAKPCMYGISYMVTTQPLDRYKNPELFKQLKKTFPDLQEVQVTKMAQRFFDMHPEVRALQMKVVRDLEDQGYVELPMTGRRLYLPPVSRGHNQAMNFFMQSSGGALINRALLELSEKTIWVPNWSAPLLQVHDELSGQIHESEMFEYGDLIAELMGQPAQFGESFKGVPAAADLGWNWNSTTDRAKFLIDGYLTQRGSAED